MTPEQSLALVEYIAHLSVEDWNGIARDLRKLGFVPAGMPPAIALVSCSCFYALSVTFMLNDVCGSLIAACHGKETTTADWCNCIVHRGPVY